MRNAECGMSGPPSERDIRVRHSLINSAFRIPHSPGGPMTSHTHYLWFNTKSRQEIIDITEQVAEQVRESGVAEGLALVSALHITASVFVNRSEERRVGKECSFRWTRCNQNE